MCIGGVRVETTTPGFTGTNVAAIANATGPDAPRTNVVRSRLESTEQWDRAVESIYSKLCAHVTSEVAAHAKGKWALAYLGMQVPFLMQPLTTGNGPTHPKILNAEIAKVPALLVEINGIRTAMSPTELSTYDKFWTIACEFFNHAEWLIREVQSNASLAALIASLNAKGLELPTDPVLCTTSLHNPLVSNVMADRQVDFIRILPDQRRVDLRWTRATAKDGKWFFLRTDVGGITGRRPDTQHSTVFRTPQ